MEDRNNQLQGYGLDDMSADELSNLIHSLTQVQHSNTLMMFSVLVEHIDQTLQMQSEDATGTKMPPCDQEPPHPPLLACRP